MELNIIFPRNIVIAYPLPWAKDTTLTGCLPNSCTKTVLKGQSLWIPPTSPGQSLWIFPPPPTPLHLYKISFVKGSGLKSNDLKRANIDQASKVVILTDSKDDLSPHVN